MISFTRPSYPSVCRLQYWHGGRPGKTDHVQLCTCGCVEEWHIFYKTANKWVHYQSQTRTMGGPSNRHQAVLAMFLGFRKLIHSCTEGICHSSTRPPNIQVCHYTWSVLPGLLPHNTKLINDHFHGKLLEIKHDSVNRFWKPWLISFHLIFNILMCCIMEPYWTTTWLKIVLYLCRNCFACQQVHSSLQ